MFFRQEKKRYMTFAIGRNFKPGCRMPMQRLPMLNAVKVPEGVDEAAVRKVLLEDHDIEIGAGLGPLAGKVWRVGVMGHTARPENIDRLLGALKATLDRQPANVQST